MKPGLATLFPISLLALFLSVALFLAAQGKWDLVVAVLAGIGVLLWQPLR